MGEEQRGADRIICQYFRFEIENHLFAGWLHSAHNTYIAIC